MSLPTGCYVYITLPGATEPVTAAHFELATTRAGDALGRLVYGKSYLEHSGAVPIDPIELNLVAGKTYETNAMSGIFGALRDAGPDYWGLRIIERHAGRAVLSELDYLLESPDDRAGALAFGLGPTPPAPQRKFNQTLSLEKLQTYADAIVNDEELPADPELSQAEELLLIATSIGGARPKTTVEDSAGLWVVKFNRPDDKWNNARTEHAMLILADACGLMAAESKVVSVGGGDVLLVKRFDRHKAKAGYQRSRMLSALTLLRAEDSAAARERWSYILLVEQLRLVSAEPKNDAFELFRRMCFNALISNTDDHPRNHAVVARDRDWRLSPAYDLTPTPHVSIERRDLAMICGDWGRFANANNLLSQHARFLLADDEAKSIVDRMRAQVKNTWYGTARAAGVSVRDCERLAGAFAYPGFDLSVLR